MHEPLLDASSWNAFCDQLRQAGQQILENAPDSSLDPPPSEYWNLQITNHWLESLDYLDYRTHYNHANAQVDDDGKVRLYIAQTDPGVANWIDTAGHCRGCISMRWIKAEEDRNAATRLVKFSGLTAG